MGYIIFFIVVIYKLNFKPEFIHLFSFSASYKVTFIRFLLISKIFNSCNYFCKDYNTRLEQVNTNYNKKSIDISMYFHCYL